MTTIATDGHTLAADSWATDASGACSITKLRRIRGWLVGYCGGAAEGSTLLRTLGRDKRDPVQTLNHLVAAGKLNKVESAFLLVSPKRGIYLYEGGASEPWRVRDRVAAIGSGGPVAMGAMKAGACPRLAVRIAAQVDPFTGGRVRAVRNDSPQKSVTPS